MVMIVERTILHADLNNFYASVECLYNPSIRQKPVAVCGDVEKRHGIILAKNELAKAYGVKTGEALWQAKEKCPGIVFVPPNYSLYLRYSKIAKEIYGEYTNQVESFGLDECWLDVSGSTALFGSGKNIADEIRKRIRKELGVTASVGVSFNKIFAKLGSDMKKPDATTVITKENYKQSVWPLPVEDLLYVGRATTKKLKKYGIHTIGKLAAADTALLKQELGINGVMLWQFANGLDRNAVAKIDANPYIKSIGNSTTLPYDVSAEEDMKITLYVLSESIAERMREHDLHCSTVQIGLRDKQLCYFERQGKLLYPTNNSETIFQKAFALYQKYKPFFPVRSVSVRACHLSSPTPRQLSCLSDYKTMEKQEKAEKAIDTIRQRFGHFSVQRAIMLNKKELSGLDPKADHVIHPIGFLGTRS